MASRKSPCSLLTLIDATGIEATDQINYRGAKIVKTPLGGCFTLVSGIALMTVAIVMFS